MSPTRYRFSTPHLQTGEPGFEPGQTESKSGVLPLDDSPTTTWRSILYFFPSFFQEKIKKNIKKDKNQSSTIIFIHTSRQKLPKKISLYIFVWQKYRFVLFLFHKKSAYWNPICWIVVLYRRKYHRLAMQTLSSSTLK